MVPALPAMIKNPLHCFVPHKDAHLSQRKQVRAHAQIFQNVINLDNWGGNVVKTGKFMVAWAPCPINPHPHE